MTRVLTLAVLLLAASTSQAREQRENCNQKAAAASGADRSEVIAQCIQRNARVTTLPPTLARMSQCNREAGEMTGEARVRFVNTCMEKTN